MTLRLGFAVLIGLSLAPLAMQFVSHGAEVFAGSEWSTEMHRDHPLVGAKWSSHDQRTLSTPETHRMLAQSDVVILGEVHDNRDHHRLQAKILQALVDTGHQPTVVFEMIPQDLQGRLSAHLGDNPGDVDGLGPAVGWQDRGWPAWSLYQPIAEVAVGNQLAIKAGGLGQSLQRKLMREGADALAHEDRRRLGLGHELPPEVASLLEAALLQSHCGLIPRDALPGMRRVQWARDGAMAAAVETAAEDGMVVLIAGAGHARRDWGVPAQLAARDGLEVTSLAFMEVTPGMDDPGEYLPAGAGQTPVYDLLVFTPRAERRDPCAALEEQLENPSATD